MKNQVEIFGVSFLFSSLVLQFFITIFLLDYSLISVGLISYCDRGGVFCPLVSLIIMAVVLCYFKVGLDKSRKEEIRKGISFYTKYDINGFFTGNKASIGLSFASNKNFFVENNGVVPISTFSRCVIIEYWSENHSYVKVRLDQYPTPLYIERCNITDDVKQTPNNIYAYVSSDSTKLKGIDEYIRLSGNECLNADFYENHNGRILIPKNAKYIILDNYDKYLRVRFQYYKDNPLYITKKSLEIINTQVETNDSKISSQSLYSNSSKKTLQCPRCRDGVLKIREGFYGYFYGCSNYPYCRYTRDLD